METSASEELGAGASATLLSRTSPRSRDRVSTRRAVEMRYMDRSGQFTWNCLEPVKLKRREDGNPWRVENK